MSTVSIEQVAVERCDGHGIWLDGQELQQVLKTAEAQATRASMKRDDRGAGEFSQVLFEALGDVTAVVNALLSEPDEF